MTLNEVAANLQHFNDWRRGHHDEQPDQRVIGEAIDAAVEMIDRLQSNLSASAQAFVQLEAVAAEARRNDAIAMSWISEAKHAIGYEGDMPGFIEALRALKADPWPTIARGMITPAHIAQDGWKLVPIVSTDEMDNAGSEHCDGYLSTAQVVWDAMLAAAPEANQ